MTQRTNCRVFQQMTDLDVAQAMLAEWGVTPIVSTTRAYKTRKYRVQYNETDHAFVSRLLEAAGVTMIFQRGDGETPRCCSATRPSAARRGACRSIT